jgi:ketosteroid isomerase-like protein
LSADSSKPPCGATGMPSSRCSIRSSKAFPSEWPESAPVRGREAAWDFGLELEAPWEMGAYEITELIEAGKDRAVMGGTREVRGKSSGVEVKQEAWGVFSFRAGRIIRIEWFSDRGEALEAAGISE